MRLGNILAQSGGVVETGRPVRFQIRQRGKGGQVTRKWCEALILPLSEDERAAAVADARTYCAEHPEASPAVEEALRLTQRFLVDPEQPAVKFITMDELPVARAGLLADQILWLVQQYQAHVREEYPELQPPAAAEDLREQIARLQKQLAALEDQAAGEL